jgi:DNA-binding XRE family transcriptional regulator
MWSSPIIPVKNMKTRIKELRARYNMTQEDLANRVGVRRETIGFLEKGKYNPSLKLAYKVAMCLQTSIDELFIFEEDDLK